MAVGTAAERVKALQADEAEREKYEAMASDLVINLPGEK